MSRFTAIQLNIPFDRKSGASTSINNKLTRLFVDNGFEVLVSEREAYTFGVTNNTAQYNSFYKPGENVQSDIVPSLIEQFNKDENTSITFEAVNVRRVFSVTGRELDKYIRSKPFDSLEDAAAYMLSSMCMQKGSYEWTIIVSYITERLSDAVEAKVITPIEGKFWNVITRKAVFQGESEQLI